MQPLTIALLAAAFAAGALVGWLLRGERRERADTIRLARLNAQLDSQREAIHRQRRQRDALQRKADDAGHRQREAERRVAAMREALDEQTAFRRKLQRRLEKTVASYEAERDARKKLSRQLRLLIQRTSQSRAAAAARAASAGATASLDDGTCALARDGDHTNDDAAIDAADATDGQGPGDAPPETPAPDAVTAPDAVAPLPSRSEDLRQVRGIGPAMARELAAWGVRTLTQLADLDERRIEALDRELRFPGRIRRERWVEQARALIGRE